MLISEYSNDLIRFWHFIRTTESLVNQQEYSNEMQWLVSCLSFVGLNVNNVQRIWLQHWLWADNLGGGRECDHTLSYLHSVRGNTEYCKDCQINEQFGSLHLKFLATFMDNYNLFWFLIDSKKMTFSKSLKGGRQSIKICHLLNGE